MTLKMPTTYLVYVKTMCHHDLNRNRMFLLNTFKLLLRNSLHKSVQATLMWFWVANANSSFFFSRFNEAETFQAEFFIKFRKGSGLRGKVREGILLIQPVCEPFSEIVIQFTIFKAKTFRDSSRCLHAANERQQKSGNLGCHA